MSKTISNMGPTLESSTGASEASKEKSESLRRFYYLQMVVVILTTIAGLYTFLFDHVFNLKNDIVLTFKKIPWLLKYVLPLLIALAGAVLGYLSGKTMFFKRFKSK